MVKCELCGQEYSHAQDCAAAAAAQMTYEEDSPPPGGFAPMYYLRLAFNIARWDDISVRRAARDPNAILYGALFWAVTALVIVTMRTLPRLVRISHFRGPTLILSVGAALVFGLVFFAAVTFIQLGLCHLIAKWFFSGTGTFIALMRALLLGWFVNAFVLIPVVGVWAAGIAWTAVLMLVFSEVDRISRLRAFFISVGVNILFIALPFLKGR
jgi:hypothetical protein